MVVVSPCEILWCYIKNLNSEFVKQMEYGYYVIHEHDSVYVIVSTTMYLKVLVSVLREGLFI